MAKAQQQAKPAAQEEQSPLDSALAADPWERTDEQRTIIVKADADVRLRSMVDDQRKMRER